MHIQWQLPGQTLGQESRLTTSVMVNLKPRPSCTQRKNVTFRDYYYYPADNRKNCFCEIILRPDKGEVSWCLTGLASFLRLWSEGVEKAWSLQLPPQQGYVCGSEHTKTLKETFLNSGGGQSLWVYLYTVCQSRYYSLGHKFVFHNICWT